MPKVYIYGPEVPDYIALVSPSRINVIDKNNNGFRPIERVAFGLALAFKDRDLNTPLIEAFSKGDSLGTMDQDLKTPLIEAVTFTNS